MTNTLAKFLIAALACFIISCDKPECKNSNPVFDANTPETEVYKTELVKMLGQADKNNLKYWINGYKEVDGQHYMLVDITGDVCATADMAISINDKQLNNFIEVKGGGYRGAGLNGLRYDITKNATGTHFIFKNLQSIRD